MEEFLRHNHAIRKNLVEYVLHFSFLIQLFVKSHVQAHTPIVHNHMKGLSSYVQSTDFRMQMWTPKEFTQAFFLLFTFRRFRGIGIRIEDEILITATGYEVLLSIYGAVLLDDKMVRSCLRSRDQENYMYSNWLATSAISRYSQPLCQKKLKKLNHG